MSSGIETKSQGSAKPRKLRKSTPENTPAPTEQNENPRTITLKNIVISGICSLVISYCMFWPEPTSTSDLGPPTVHLDNATFTGTAAGTVEQFLGIPFAKPPVGVLRFRPPEPVDAYVGTHSAAQFGFACPQMVPKVAIPEGLSAAAVGYTKVIHAAEPDSEDCLTLDVVRPAGIAPNSGLPVLVWFFGGGNEFGGTSKSNGIPIVMRSVEMGQPIIYVAMNYRLNAFGFLASKEVKEAGAGNLGLRDQREALKWIQKYIPAFGGDPSKVTIWGQSAGAISVGNHLVIKGGNHDNLFRAAIMQSGAPSILSDITDGQKHYDALVQETACGGAEDTLECLRQVPYNELKGAIQKSPGLFEYNSLDLTWPSRVDGDLIPANPFKLVHDGLVADVPFMIGCVDDEGTLFSLALANITTDEEFRTYMAQHFLQAASHEEVDKLMELYPQDPTRGSPYDMGMYGADLTPQFKRLASILGDMAFQSLRRYVLNERAGSGAWSFVSKRWKGIEHLGAAHSSDLVDVFSGGVTADYFIQFASTLDPNGGSERTIAWPRYSKAEPKLMTLLIDDEEPLVVAEDTFRTVENDYWIELGLKYQL